MKVSTLLMTTAASTALACMLGGAAHHAAPHATASAPQAEWSGTRGMCPMDVPGTKLSAADTPNGETLTFITTTADQVPALRERTRAMAEMHNQHHAAGAGGGMHQGQGGVMGGEHGMHDGEKSEMMPPPSRAVVEDVENGARIVVTANDPADLRKLQSTVRMHAQHMQQQGCGMMDGGATHH